MAMGAAYGSTVVCPVTHICQYITRPVFPSFLSRKSFYPVVVANHVPGTCRHCVLTTLQDRPLPRPKIGSKIRADDTEQRLVHLDLLMI